MNVTPKNHVPVCEDYSGDATLFYEAETIVAAVLKTPSPFATDPLDTGDTFTFSITSASPPPCLSVSGTTTLSIDNDATCTNSDVGFYSITVTATDNNSVGGASVLSCSTTIAYYIGKTNHAPTFTSDITDKSFNNCQNDAFVHTFSDVDLDSVTLTATEPDSSPLDPAWVSFAANTLTFAMCDGTEVGNSYPILLTLTDNNAIAGVNGVQSSQRTIIYTLNGFNAAPDWALTPV